MEAELVCMQCGEKIDPGYFHITVYEHIPDDSPNILYFCNYYCLYEYLKEVYL